MYRVKCYVMFSCVLSRVMRSWRVVTCDVMHCVMLSCLVLVMLAGVMGYGVFCRYVMCHAVTSCVMRHGVTSQCVTSCCLSCHVYDVVFMPWRSCRLSCLVEYIMHDVV